VYALLSKVYGIIFEDFYFYLNTKKVNKIIFLGHFYSNICLSRMLYYYYYYYYFKRTYYNREKH